MGLKSYTSVAASNTSLFPEGMAPSMVNDSARQVQADIRSWYLDAQWIDRGDPGISRASASSFKITGDVTGEYLAGRRLKLYDATTLYGVISSSSYSAPDTTINVTTDSGNLTTSLTSVGVGILTPTNKSFPSMDFDTLTVSGAAQFKSTVTASGAAVFKTTVLIEGATTISGAATFNSTLTASGAAVFKTTVLIEGATTLSGAATFNSTVTVSGAAVFKTTASIEGECTISGTATLKTVVVGAAVADQSAMEASTAVNRIVSPGNQQFHPGHPKSWVAFQGTGTVAITASYNTASVTDNGTGDYNPVFTNNMSSTSYNVNPAGKYDGSVLMFACIGAGGKATTGYNVITSGATAMNTVRDCPDVNVTCLGDR